MSARGPSKHFRSPGRRLSGDRDSAGRNDRFPRRDSPDRSKRSRWESPSKTRKGEPDFGLRPRGRDNDSPLRSRRSGFDSPPRSRRSGFDSSPRFRRTGFESPPRFGRPGFDDGILRGDPHLRMDGDPRFHAFRNEEHRVAAHGPAGLVFLCSGATQRECFVYGVFGLPLAQREIVERVVPGTRLFLFNLDTKELFGIFEAVSPGGINLVPEAFADFKGSYAAQVRFRILRECYPLANEVFQDVLKDNLSQKGKFDCELNADQVFRLMELFARTEVRLGPRMGMGFRDPAMGILPSHEGGPFPSLHPYEKTDGNLPPGRDFISDPHLITNKGDPLFSSDGNKPPADGGPVDAVAILGQGVLDEVDQLALKYLQNDPRFATVHLEPIDLNLLSHSFGDHSKSGMTNSHLDSPQVGMQQHPDMRFGPNVGALPSQNAMQPDGAGFPGQRSWNHNMQPPVFGGSAGMGVSQSDKHLPPGSVSPFTSNPATFGKELGLMSNEKGLLPIPGAFHHMPPHSFPVGNGPFPGGNPMFVQGMGAGPSSGALPMPFRPPQAGGHMIPPNMGHRSHASPNKLSKKKAKKLKKKKFQSQAAVAPKEGMADDANKKGEEAGGDESDKDSQPAAAEPSP